MLSQNLSHLSDDQLIEDIRQDKHDAFEEIYSRHWESMFFSAFRILKDREVCSDIVQEVFLDIWLKRQTLHIENPKAFFYIAVRNRVLMQLRRQKLSQAHLQTLDVMEVDNATENTVYFNELTTSLDKSVSHLPEKCREVFKLSRYDNLSHSEIAMRLNLSVRTVEAHIHQALKQLRLPLNDLSGVVLLVLSVVHLLR